MPGTFVSIGNGTQSFERLLDAVVAIADQLPQPVIVQHGRTPFNHESIEHFAFTDEAGFREYLFNSDLFITHGGGGSVFAAIRMGKKPVVVPRRQQFDEIVDDHQLLFTAELARQRRIEPAYEIADLGEAASRVLDNPSLPNDVDDRSLAIGTVAAAVREFAPTSSDKVMLVAPSGGHLSEIRNLVDCYADRAHHFVINVPIVEDEFMRGRTSVISLSQRDWRFFKNVLEAWKLLRRERPNVILTTGGSMSVPFAWIGWAMHIPTVYVETVAKVSIPTLTGRIIYPIATRFYYQWSYLEKYFPKGKFIGLIL